MSFLKDSCGFNLRERVNVYSGLVLGAFTPIAITRYTTIRSMAETKGIVGELAAWTASAIINITSGLPVIVVSSAIGGAAGWAYAEQLKKQRIKEPASHYANLTDGHNPLANLSD